jgi:hypothetical protein
MDGSTYDGDWVAGEMEGFGELKVGTEIYEGQFKASKKNGLGKVY